MYVYNINILVYTMHILLSVQHNLGPRYSSFLLSYLGKSLARVWLSSLSLPSFTHYSHLHSHPRPRRDCANLVYYQKDDQIFISWFFFKLCSFHTTYIFQNVHSAKYKGFMSIYLDLTLFVSMILNKLIKMQSFEDMLYFKYESILLKTAKITFSSAFFFSYGYCV